MADVRYPALYQINTRVWLTELSARWASARRWTTFRTRELDRLAELGFDWLWFLSVWQTGPAAQAISRANPEWRREFAATLPDFKDEDIAGSGFAIQNYTVHRDLGGAAALARLRQRLQQRGLRLMLDFVPNHMAPDHPWVDQHPDYFVHGSESDLARAPQNYCRVQIEERAAGARLWPRPVLRRLARHTATQLRQPGLTAGDDRRAGENCRPMRRRALRYGDACSAGGV